MIPPKRPTLPPRRPSAKPTPPAPGEIKKGQLHPYWIDRYRHYHQGEKFVAKVTQ